MAIDEVSETGAGAPPRATSTPPVLAEAPVRIRPAAPSAAEDLAGRIARLRAEITALVALDPAVDGANGPALHAELRTAAGQLQAFAARILARVEADGRWSAGGARTFPDWVARRQLASTGAVRREVTLGRALDQALPQTATALAKGHVTLEHAEVLARVAATTDARRAALASDLPDRNEAALLESARRMPLDSYRREVDRWATQVDAAAAESEHETACTKEYLTLSRRHDGVALQGFLTLESAEVLATALRSVAGVPSRGETRSREERQAAALVDAGRLILDRGLAGTGHQVRPHLLVHVPAATLRRVEADQRGEGGPGGEADRDHPEDAGAHPSRFDGLPPATLHDGSPIPPSTLARLICDGELTRIVFGADGAVLDVGRARRTYSGQQRLAVIARDQTCRYPGCGAPPTLGEVHHVTSWATGGPTSVANGVLLCWFHHALVHRRSIRVTRAHGGWKFRRGDGSPIDDGRATAALSDTDEVHRTTAAGGPAPGDTAPGSTTSGLRSPARSVDTSATVGAPPSAWGGPIRPPGDQPHARPPGNRLPPRSREPAPVQGRLALPA